MNKINRYQCPLDKDIIRNRKRYLKEQSIELETPVIKKKSESHVCYINDKLKNSLNPFLKSLVGIASLNLDYYRNILNVYYCENNEELKEMYKFTFGEEYKVVENSHQKNNYLALNSVADLINLKIRLVGSFEEADLIISNIEEYNHWNYYATSPEDLDCFKLLENKLHIIYSGIGEGDNTEPGSYYFMIFLASFLKCLGMKNPRMPGTNNKKNSGFMGMDTLYNTILSENKTNLEYINKDNLVVWDSLSFPRTMMALDYQAFRILYNYDSIKSNSFNDLSIEEDTTQTLAGQNIKLEIDDEDAEIILNLDKYNANPICDKQTNHSTYIRNNSKKNGITFLDNLSSISEVNVVCDTLYLYNSDFDIDCLINAECNKIVIYLVGNENEYELNELKEEITISKDNTMRIVTNCLEININYSGYMDNEDNKNYITDNLRDKHIKEILEAYRKEYAEIDEEQIQEFAVDYLTKKFNEKIKNNKMEKILDYLKKMN